MAVGDPITTLTTMTNGRNAFKIKPSSTVETHKVVDLDNVKQIINRKRC